MRIIDENPVEGSVGGTSTASTSSATSAPPTPRTTPPAPPKSYIRAGNVYLGVVAALAGLLWLASNYGAIGGLAERIIFSVWMLMIAIGGYLLALRKVTGGIIVTVIGAVMLVVDTLECYISLDRIILPALLIMVGILILAAQLHRKK